MSWSPSEAAPLPSAVLGQSSPAAASGSRHVPLASPPSQPGRDAAGPAQDDSVTGTRGTPRTVPSRPLTTLKQQQPQQQQQQQHVRAVACGPSSSTAPAAMQPPDSSRPVPGGSSQRRGQQKQKPQGRKAHPTGGGPSGIPSDRTSAKTELSDPSSSANDDLSFFKLTDKELRMLRRTHRKEPTYTGFKDSIIARELNRLGRGWDGYVRASLKAGQEGRSDEFLRRFQHERRSISTGLPLPAGSISMQAAADAADRVRKATLGHTGQPISQDRAKVNGSKEMSMQAVGSHRGRVPAGLVTSSIATGHQGYDGQCESTCERPASNLKLKSTEADPAELGLVQSDLTSVYQIPEPMETSGSDYQAHPRGQSKGSKNKPIASSILADRPRPRRVEIRPDYRIRRIRERRSDMPPRPSSPSPRDLYERTHPQFLHFKCEWAGCKAVLNNTANLRKHVIVVHGQGARETLCCSWGKCGRDDGNGMLSTFRSVDDLDEHFQTLHMESMRWHLGDGRLGRGLVVKAQPPLGDTSYLYRDGKQVTPSVSNQKMETLAEWRVRKGKLKEMLLKATSNAPSDSEDFEDGEDVEHMMSSVL